MNSTGRVTKRTTAKGLEHQHGRHRMNAGHLGLARIGVAAAALAVAVPAAAAEALPLRRVLLSSGGVGYFEHAARVSGDADLSLTLRLDQIDDALKSIVVFDDRGAMGEVTLPGKSAMSEAFRDLPFDPGSLGSQASLLAALRGAEVAVTIDDVTHTGRVLSISTELTQLPDKGGAVVRHRLALASDGAITSVIIEDADAVRLLDPALAEQLDAALASLLAQKDRGRRTLTIATRGAGEREVRVGYVTAVPLWKSTYRLMLGSDVRESKAELIGLAVVENQSGAPFEEVDLTLVAGNPVAFRQALYQSYYVDRPEIPVEVAGRVLPRLDEGAIAVEDKAMDADARASMPMGAGGGAGESASFGPPSMAPSPRAPLAESVEQATQIVFHLPEPVTLASGESALIPIIDRAVPAERVSIYQPDVDARHAFASIVLDNDGDTGLPPGVLTTFERGPSGVTYLGDARLAALPAGERRIVSFGLDPKLRIDRSQSETQEIARALIDAGVLHLVRLERIRIDHTLAGAQREPRTVIIEQPRLHGFDLTSSAGAPVEITPEHYRVRVEVPAGATVKLPLVLDRPLEQTVIIADLSSATLAAYATNDELPASVREALGAVARLRAAMEEKAGAVKRAEAELARITADQARVREDLKVVPVGSALAQRYLTLLGEQEDHLAELAKELAEARQAERDARRALAEAIRALRA